MRQLGYLGKTPHRGDFVRYNVPSLLHSVWDDWLAAVLVDATESMMNWPEGYDAAPLWRFALSPDIAGDEARAGVMVASRDSVGRRFPFTLFGGIEETMTPLETLVSDTTLDTLEASVRQAVEEESAYETLKETLGALQDAQRDDPGATCPPFRAGTATHSKEPAVYCEDAEILVTRGGTARLLDAALRQSTGPYSVWQRRDDNHGDGCLFVTGGLPRSAAAFVLFGADWPTSSGGRLGGGGGSDTQRPGDARSALRSAVEPGQLLSAPTAPPDTQTSLSPEPGIDEPGPIPMPAPERSPDTSDADAAVATNAPALSTDPVIPTSSGVEAVPLDRADQKARPSTKRDDIEPVEHDQHAIETLDIEDDEDEAAPWDR